MPSIYERLLFLSELRYHLITMNHALRQPMIIAAQLEKSAALIKAPRPFGPEIPASVELAIDELHTLIECAAVFMQMELLGEDATKNIALANAVLIA
jgi:hypothetical protein